MLSILEKFEACSGQQINHQKSRVFFSKNTPHYVQHAINSQLHISPTADLGRYLGMPILSRRKGRADYSFLIDKVQKKLTGWKAKTLSQAGHVLLAQRCLMSFPNYVMQTALIPASICDEIERIFRDFN